jgi:hypothetical protein
MSSFWIGGPDAYETAIRQQYDQRIRDCQQQLRQAVTLDEKSRLSAEIREMEEDLRQKLAKMDRCLW